MESTMLVAGIVCLMGAVVGGGLKAFQIELPLLQSRGRQAALGSLGVVLIAGALILKERPASSGKVSAIPESPAIPSSMLPAGLKRNNGVIHLGQTQNGKFVDRSVIDQPDLPSEKTFVTVAAGDALHLWSNVPGGTSEPEDLGVIPERTLLFVTQREPRGPHPLDYWADVKLCSKMDEHRECVPFAMGTPAD